MKHYAGHGRSNRFVTAMQDLVASSPRVSRHRVALLCVSGFLGLLLGLALSNIPSPNTVRTVWVGNFASPWLAGAFLAGWSQTSQKWSVLSACVFELICLCAFYGRFLFLRQGGVGLHGGHAGSRLSVNLNGWLVLVYPWIPVAFAAGVIFGVLGYYWGHSRYLFAGLMLGAPFVIEPFVWTFIFGYRTNSTLAWLAESSVGLMTISMIAMTWRRSSGAHTSVDEALSH